ncbi:unnamed protein product [Taenia asiatica]|uniref:Pseudouridylate synthase 1 homolog n=1 Tax=Taenia asiatica TaxID=60517 RepID=A0A0R3W683_TAEAS|nr:unnamed protein product [Taenia asiatica]
MKRQQEPDCEASYDAKAPKFDQVVSTGARGFRKCAILVVYSGAGFCGMQRNEGFRTIEGELMMALCNAGYILEEHMKNPSMFSNPVKIIQICFQRASKTDKNVSAAGQVCAAKLPIDTLSVDKINSHLPDQIRILDVFRVTKKFNPKTACNHRIYQYLLPTFSFSPGGSITLENCWKYRFSAETLTRVNELFRYYKGTHNFFNFTSRRTPDDKSCQRYIMSIECGSPFLLDGDREFALITVQGQSFMLHQIRKMIGLVIAIAKGYATEAIFENVFKTERMDVPMAPGLGLLLDQVDYTLYNKRFCADGSHQSIDWERYKRQIDEFKEAYIFQHIVKHEVEDNSMFEWMGNLSNHSYDRREGESSPSSATASPATTPQLTTQEAVAGANSALNTVEM